MKTMKFMSKFFMSFLTVMLFIGCSPEDGKDGENGTDGIDGIDGTDGEQGETGTANVIYSDWIDSPFDSTILDSSGNESISVPSLSQEIIDQGVVLVYGRDNINNVYAIPFIGIQGVSYYYRYNFENINIRLATLDGSNIGSPLFSSYRYVLVPGGVEASNGIGGIGSKTSTIDYTKMSYEEVIAHFNIPE